MSKQFIGVIIAIIVVFGGIIALTGNKSDSSGSSSSGKTQPTEHITGNKNASVTLVEYGDFQCPYCQQYEPTIEQVVNDYSSKIRFQFRNFPLSSLHRNAFAAARAAEAAGLQNKYWEMHSLLYQTQNWQVWTQSSTPTTYFNQYAQQLGLNVNQFTKDFASSKVNDLVNADMAAGNKLNITGTPSFFLDGKQVQIPNDVDSFKKVLDAEIAKKSPQQTGSTQPAESTQPTADTTPATGQ